MKSFSSLFPVGLLTLLLLALRLPAAAQAPAWQSAQAVAVATAAGSSVVTATAVDAAGNVYLAGVFSNSMALGSTILTSLGNFDTFVAKFDPASNQFVWAVRAGGVGDDIASALAVSGSSVYVAGGFTSVTASFGTTTLPNASSTGDADVFIAKLTDGGSTGNFEWAQRAGGTGYDGATALAVSGTSIYVAGSFRKSTANFGPIILTNANANVYSDAFVAKLIDAGSTGSFAWAQRAGGMNDDQINALAVSGANVYVAGNFGSPTAGFGPITLTNTNQGLDVFVAKLTDTGNSSSFTWAQRAGNTGVEYATALAVSGTSVFVAGSFNSSTVDFGSTTLANGGGALSFDVFVAKLIDTGAAGSFAWAQRAGGTADESVNSLIVSGANVFVAGGFESSTAGFGSVNLTNTSSPNKSDMFVAKLTDAGSTGSFAWAQQADGVGIEAANGLALVGTKLYVVGFFQGFTAGFGTTTIFNSYFNQNPNSFLGFLAFLTDPTLTATTAAAGPREPASLFPNPARHAATLRLPAGTAPAPLTLTDALGRAVRHYPAPTGPEAALDLRGLLAGLYLLRGASPAQRLVVE